MMPKWEVWYDEDPEWGIYDSEWDQLEEVGVVKINVFWPEDPNHAYCMVFSGWDVYWVEEDHENEVLKIGVWKEDDPSDSHYQMGRERHFHADGVTHTETDYLPMSTWSGIPVSRRKRGVWVSDERAAEIGVGP